jgi:hypothetical protein
VPHTCLRSGARVAQGLLVLALAACSSDKGALLAPTDAVISLASAAPYVTINGSVNVTIKATAADGTPVPDGTEILLTGTRGEFASAKVRTRGGQVVVGYQAAPDPGPVELFATSNEAQGRLVLPTASSVISRISLSASKAALPFGGGTVDVRATVFGPSGERVVSAPVVFVAANGTFETTEPLLTDENGQATAELAAKQATTARARVHTLESNPLNIAMEPKIDLSVKAQPASALVGQPVKFTITPTDPKRVGNLTMNYGDGQLQDIGQGSGVRDVFYTYSAAGGYNVSATFTTTLGTVVRQTIRFNVAGIAPVPPPSGGGGGVIDDPNLPFSLSQVTWLHTNVGGWPATSKITDVSISPTEICIEHTMSGRWPTFRGDGGVIAEGNPWVFANVGGRWYAATYEFLRSGQTCKHIERRGEWGIGAHTKKDPLESWVPRKGERVGFMVSTPARDSTRTSNERSNIVMVTWPY